MSRKKGLSISSVLRAEEIYNFLLQEEHFHGFGKFFGFDSVNIDSGSD